MRLGQLGRCFRKAEGIWIPKKKYNTEEEAGNDPNLQSSRWEAYKCSECSYYHVADREKVFRRDK